MRVAHRLALALLCLSMLLLPTRAGATVADLVGVGGKAIALGGAFTAVADDFSATWYNPAGLTQPSSIEVSTGILLINYNLEINGQSQDAESIGGAYIGIVAPLFHGRGAAGIWGYYPQNLLLRNDFVDPLSPSFPLLQNSANLFDLSAALAFDINDKLSVGVGIRLLNVQETTISLGLPIVFNAAGRGGSGERTPIGFAELDVNAKNRIRPVGGVLYKPYENMKIGITYRAEIKQDIKINQVAPVINSATIVNVGFPDPLAVQRLLRQNTVIEGSFEGIGFFSPQQVAVGIAYEPSPRTTISADLVWENWSAFIDDRLQGKNFTDFNFFLGLAKNPLLTNFRKHKSLQTRDILVPRIGIEHRFPTKRGPLGPIDLALRMGYAFRPSVVKNNQNGGFALFSITPPAGSSAPPVSLLSTGSNFVDADIHIVSAGLGITLDDPLGWAEKWVLDLYWQSQLLNGRTFRNQAFPFEFAQFGPRLKAGGTITAAGGFFTAKF